MEEAGKGTRKGWLEGMGGERLKPGSMTRWHERNCCMKSAVNGQTYMKAGWGKC